MCPFELEQQLMDSFDTNPRVKATSRDCGADEAQLGSLGKSSHKQKGKEGKVRWKVRGTAWETDKGKAGRKGLGNAWATGNG